MTRAEAIDRIQKILDYMESLDADEEELKDIEALRMAIQALQMELNCKNCVFRMGYGTGIDAGILNAIPKKMKEGE